MEPMHALLAGNWRHATFAFVFFFNFPSTQNLQINNSYSTIHSQHDEGYEEEERPDLGSWQGCYGLWIHLKYQSRSCMEKMTILNFQVWNKLKCSIFRKKFNRKLMNFKNIFLLWQPFQATNISWPCVPFFGVVRWPFFYIKTESHIFITNYNYFLVTLTYM